MSAARQDQQQQKIWSGGYSKAACLMIDREAMQSILDQEQTEVDENADVKERIMAMLKHMPIVKVVDPAWNVEGRENDEYQGSYSVAVCALLGTYWNALQEQGVEELRGLSLERSLQGALFESE